MYTFDDSHRQQLDRNGFCVVQGALTAAELARARQALDKTVAGMRARDQATFDPRLDPNDANIRVYNLPEHDPVFVELLRHPAARAVVEAVLGANVLVSNFTANIALPGSGPMALHSDQALAIPEPWDRAWTLNVIWCLDDVHADNGATRYLPGSHHYRTRAEVPADAPSRMRAFEAPAGSIIAMEGRLWHTSGSNVTPDQQRRLMFAYYTMDFIRQQANWEGVLSDATKAGLDDDARRMLGLGAAANTRMAGALTRLQPA